MTTHDLINECAELFRAHDLPGTVYLLEHGMQHTIPNVPMTPTMHRSDGPESAPPVFTPGIEPSGPAAAAPTLPDADRFDFREVYLMGVAEGDWVREADYEALSDRAEELQRSHIEWLEAHGKEVEAALVRASRAERERDAIEAGRINLEHALSLAMQRADELQRERDEAMKDAQRYRWLRSKTKQSMTSKKHAGNIQVIQWESSQEANALHADAMDAAIDAAISAMEQK